MQPTTKDHKLLGLRGDDRPMKLSSLWSSAVALAVRGKTQSKDSQVRLHPDTPSPSLEGHTARIVLESSSPGLAKAELILVVPPSKTNILAFALPFGSSSFVPSAYQILNKGVASPELHAVVDLVRLALPSNDPPVAPSPARLPLQPEIESLSAALFAATLSNNGPDLNSQPSKLWASRQEYQAECEMFDTHDFPLPDIDVLASAVSRIALGNGPPDINPSLPTSVTPPTTQATREDSAIPAPTLPLEQRWGHHHHSLPLIVEGKAIQGHHDLSKAREC
ncbi:hypothetical protein PAXINDRAFT_17213 [Paxillus involutus ATCC 200175]|uniref:Uncharacterized protein n=1 Tax=Paxillus involutus ATCC 200175 TaxID=664439 RepID=A0A0C9TRF0_PAXIN|nr:hypothetical protein PAXINDRAFT_17213 [Paxillus involutus ATCC 200175]